MSTVDRCTCIPHYQDAGAGYTEYVPEWVPSCSEHGEVDHILASGEYLDRKSELWHQCECPADGCGNWHMHHPSRGITPAQMRLLIERDQHRDECPGLALCRAHPVPFVILWPMPTAIPAHSTIGKTHYTMGEALEEARRMAANE